MVRCDDSTSTLTLPPHFFHFAIGPRSDPGGVIGEAFHLDPRTTEDVLNRYHATLARRDAAQVEASLARLAQAARTDDDNLMPHLIDCCHAYATVGEMVSCLKNEWGEFEEPTGL